MPEPRPDAYALLESSFHASPNLRSHKQLPRHRDEHRSYQSAAEPLKQAAPHPDDATNSHINSQHSSPLASPGALNGADNGLPPTPPSNSQDEKPESSFSPPPHADGVVASLMVKKSSLSTPVNQRSPPTPDPSPPRTTESMTVPERPHLYTYPSSRAESFKTAREDPFSSDGESRSSTPLGHRLSTVEEDRGLGLAFERDDNDITPTNRVEQIPPEQESVNPESGENKDPLDVDDIPNREWDTNLMRNVTIRRKRNSKPSPQKNSDSTEPSPASPATRSTPRRSTSLRQRIEASKDSPHTPSIENFAQSIGWPSEAKGTPEEGSTDVDSKRFSGSSMSSTVVEAMVIVTPPQRRRTLRHSGKNLAYRRDTDSPSDLSSATYSNRNSMHSDDVPLHRLVHKRVSINDRTRRISVESDTLGNGRNGSSISLRKRSHDASAYTLAHQESVRRVLQPAAEIMSRSNSLSRPHTPGQSFHKRISSAPEPTKRREVLSPGPRTFLELSPPESPTRKKAPKQAPKIPQIERTSPSTPGFNSHDVSPTSPKVNASTPPDEPKSPVDVNKSLPELPTEKLPIQSTNDLESKEEAPAEVTESQEEKRPPSALLERVRVLLAEREAAESVNAEFQESNKAEETKATKESPEPSRPRASSLEAPSVVRRGSRSSRGRSEERRRSSHSQDRTSTSRDTLLRPSLDRVSTEEVPRHSHEWHRSHSDEHRRISFDRSTTRTEEHAMARHLFAQTTPFSQFSDTPIEVSEATAVSIYPHNNHSLLVVQQVSRSNSMAPEPRQVLSEAHFVASNHPEPGAPPTPPFVDASESHHEQHPQPQQPTLTFEPSTPPMTISLPNPNVVDSPLKNPRPPPEPPVIKFIPPTPAEELEKQLSPGPPGPPKRSDSHPQRRLSLVQRARRYSDNFISPFLARASSTRGRHASDSRRSHEHPRVPTVSDEDGTLHPFWRPRGFWDGFDDSDSESDDDVLPEGGDTSDVGEDGDESNDKEKRKLGVLGRRLTNGFKGKGTAASGFLIGNSLGVERHGTNRRRPVVQLPSRSARAGKTKTDSPKILIQPPTLPLRPRSPRVEKRGSRASMRSSGSWERSRRFGRRDEWRKGKRIPGLKGVQVQYIGLSGVKERFRERKAEKRRENIRKSIGSRYYMEPSPTVG